MMESQNLKEFYEEEAKFVERYSAKKFWDYRYHNKRKEILQAMLKETQKDCVSFLDVGCGTGEYLFFMSKTMPTVIGIDLSKRYLQRCSSNRNNNLILCDSRYLPLKNQAIDCVLCSEVIEHIKPHEESIQEILRVSKKTAIISTPNNGILRILLSKLQKQKLSALDVQVGHINILNFQELLSKFKNPKKPISLALTVNIFPPLFDDFHLPAFTEPLINLVETFLNKLLPTMGNITIIKLKKK